MSEEDFKIAESLSLRYHASHDGRADRENSEGAATRLREWLVKNGRPAPEATAKERLKHEFQSLLSWAEEEGALITPDSYAETVSSYAERAFGQEHFVYLPPPTSLVLKTTIPPNYGLMGDAISYLRNIELANQYLGDDIRVVGIVLLDGEPAIVTTQPYVEGRRPTRQKIERWFAQRGYQALGNDRYQNSDLGLIIEDAHEGNLMEIDGGELVPIDVHLLEY